MTDEDLQTIAFINKIALNANFMTEKQVNDMIDRLEIFQQAIAARKNSVKVMFLQ